MQNTPRVTHGEVLRKADLHNLPRKCVHTGYIMGRFYAKKSYCREKFCIKPPHIIYILYIYIIYTPNHSTIVGGIYAKVTLGMYPLIESERS